MRTAIAKDPQQVDAYWILASILRERLNNPEQADEIIDKMVEANPGNRRGPLEPFPVHRQVFPAGEGVDVTQRQAQRKEDVKKALSLDPDDADTLLIAAGTAIEDQKMEEARRYLEHGAKLYPDDARIVQQLIGIDVHEKKFDDISERLKKGPKTASLQQLDFEMKVQARDLPGGERSWPACALFWVIETREPA